VSKGSGYGVPEPREHLLRSKFVAQAFKIKVLLPMMRADGTEQFPVLYVTDADDFFGGFSTVLNCLQNHGEIPRLILVGIGYEDPKLSAVLRMRDLFTHANRSLYATEIRGLAESAFVSDVGDLNSILSASDAQEFLQFIRKELIPLITSEYPVSPADNSFFGYSAGGGFGAHVLFTQPDTFRRYILGSPAVSYNGYHFGIDMARQYLETNSRLDAKVFMSVGELEEFKRGLGPLDLVTGYCSLAKFLKSAAIAGLDLSLRIFPGETHATAWAPALSHGLKTLFGPVDQVPYWPEFLK
jgi:uncharacterized protein